MTDLDLNPFLDTFRELRGVLVHRRLEEKEESQQESAYFHALRRYPFPDVRVAADSILRSTSKFPSPAEWIAALPKARPDARQLHASEAREFVRARDLGWTDEPCDCVSCRAANVTMRRLRFVPTVDERTGETDQAIDARGQLVTPGHWAHGWELSRWYASHATYQKALRATEQGKAMPALSEAERATLVREPGSDDE